MIIYNTNTDKLDEVAQFLDMKIVHLPTHTQANRVNLRSLTGGLVCWHQHRDFFQELFVQSPKAIINTYVIDKSNPTNKKIAYYASNFDELYPPTGEFFFRPGLPYRLCCNCEQEIPN